GQLNDQRVGHLPVEIDSQVPEIGRATGGEIVGYRIVPGSEEIRYGRREEADLIFLVWFDLDVKIQLVGHAVQTHRKGRRDGIIDHQGHFSGVDGNDRGVGQDAELVPKTELSAG